MRYLAGIFKLPYDPALCLTFLTRRRIASFFVSSMYRLEAYLFFASIANISSIFQYLDHSNMLFHPLPWGGETNTVQFHKSFVYRRALLQWEAMCTELVRRSVVVSQIKVAPEKAGSWLALGLWSLELYLWSGLLFCRTAGLYSSFSHK